MFCLWILLSIFGCSAEKFSKISKQIHFIAALIFEISFVRNRPIRSARNEVLADVVLMHHHHGWMDGWCRCPCHSIFQTENCFSSIRSVAMSLLRRLLFATASHFSHLIYYSSFENHFFIASNFPSIKTWRFSMKT